MKGNLDHAGRKHTSHNLAGNPALWRETSPVVTKSQNLRYLHRRLLVAQKRQVKNYQLDTTDWT